MNGLESLALAYLLNAAWQLPLWVALAVLVTRRLERLPARLLHALWTAVAIAAVVLPAFATAGRSAAALPDPGRAAFAGASAETTGSPALAGPDAERPPSESRTSWRVPRPPFAPLVLGVWGLSMALALAGLARAAVRARRLLADCEPVEPTSDLAALFARAREREGFPAARLLTTRRRSPPAATGIFRPTVLLSSGLVATATPAELDAALAHEIAHLRRRDPARHLALQFLLVPLAFHPATRPLRRALAISREAACDERAAVALGRRAYGRALLDLTALVAGFPRPVLPLGVADGDDLQVRMKRLQPSFVATPRPHARAALVAAGLVLALAGAAAVAFAGSVEAAATAGVAEERLAGVWLGTLEGGDGDGQPGASLTVSLVDGAPHAALLLYRYQKQTDGTLVSRAVALPVVSESLEGPSLRLTTRDDRFRFRGAPASSADFEWRFTWLAPGSGRLELVANSYFVAARARGEAVPPPPPAMAMKLQE